MFPFLLKRTLSQARHALRFESLQLIKTASLSSHIKREPSSTSIGITKVMVVLVPGMYFGGRLGRNLAEFLDEWSIFNAEDDDEDD